MQYRESCTGILATDTAAIDGSIRIAFSLQLEYPEFPVHQALMECQALMDRKETKVTKASTEPKDSLGNQERWVPKDRQESPAYKVLLDHQDKTLKS